MLNAWRGNDPPNVFRFTLKMEYVENRSVRRSLDFVSLLDLLDSVEDDTDNNILWYIRLVPIGHSSMFYLCRNAHILQEYYEFIYEYNIVSGDGEFINGSERRAMVDPSQLCEEYLDPTIPIPVHPQKNWFLLQIKILHLTPNEFSNHQNENLADSINNMRLSPAQPTSSKKGRRSASAKQ
ncbi:hypothetical protein M3Y97_00266500 [Aphelenchoides bicaudatus]|nr:hypothetical protein M3Y97_00266500 [Aphelenchoides bicaudatus]